MPHASLKPAVKLISLASTSNVFCASNSRSSFLRPVAWGLARELEADGLYSFEREEEERICHPAEQED